MSRPLRFCMLTTFYPPWNFGGDGIQVERLVGALADQGHQVVVVCAPKAHWMFGGGRVTAPARHPNVEVVTLPDGVLSLTGTYLAGRPMRSRGMLRDILDRGFDVVHFHNPSLLGAPGLFELGDGPLKLYTAHDQWLLCPSHVLLRRDGTVCEDPPCWSCELAHLRPPQPWRRTGLLERSLSRLDALIVPSRSSARLHDGFRKRVRIEVIAHFVPPSVAGAATDSAAPARERPFFLFAGRFERIKGVEGLIEAFRHRRSEDLVIAGDGSLARRLHRQAAGLPINFPGQLSQRELAPLYRDAIAVVMSTVGHEGLPQVPLEAFAVGTPAIVPRFGAMEEVIEDTGAGIAYSSPEELQAALDRLAGDRDLRDELGRRGLAAIRERYTPAAHLSRYLGLVAELARERGDSGLAGAAGSAAEGAAA